MTSASSKNASKGRSFDDLDNKGAPHYLNLMARMFGFSLLAFLLIRLVMIAFYPDYFSGLPVSEILYALLYGVRFDSATVIILGSIFWLLLLIPLPGFQHPRVRQTLAWLYLLLLLVVFALCLGDVYYFGEVERHVGRELLNIGNDLSALVEIAFKGAPLFTAFSFAILAAFTFIWWRWVIVPAAVIPRRPKSIIKKTFVVFLVLLLAVFLGRGMVLKSRPIAVVDAFVMPTPKSANLALNGVFVLMKEISRPDREELSLLNQDKFTQLNQAYIGQDKGDLSSLFNWDKSRFKAPAYKPMADKNVVVILLESWSYRFVDALGKNGYGATPFMDSLIEKSQVWDRFYAAGQRSIHGIQAMLSSVPILHNYPSLGFGLETNSMSEVGSIAQQKGYETFFLQSSDRRSFHMDGIASRLGFKYYYGKEDIPIIKDYPQEVPSFGWDYDTLMFLHGKLDEHIEEPKNQRFLAVLFTGSTHLSYPDPGAQFHIREHDPKGENGFLNTLRYSDWALEQFMTAAKQSSWYEDTVFIFLADHTSRIVNEALSEQFHIPLVIFAPDGSLPPKRHQHVTSQYDILPTIMDLIQAPQTITSFGRSLFDDVTNRSSYALVSKGSLYGVIHEQGWATFSGQKDIQEEAFNDFNLEQISYLRDHARWSLQHVDKALNNNKWAPHSPSSH